jgi:uncharacterized membrane protein (DUF373 family)
MMRDENQFNPHAEDRLLTGLAGLIRIAVRVLAVMMTVVIVLGVVDVAWTLHQRAMAPPRYVLTISDILGVFGAFMAVLIAIEIFVNITVYLRENVIHVRIVVATALMAIARKVIILDYEEVSPEYVWATPAVVLAMSVAYWLVLHGGAAEREIGAATITVPARAAAANDTPSLPAEPPGRQADS